MILQGSSITYYNINGFVQKKIDSIANALELCLVCTTPLISS